MNVYNKSEFCPCRQVNFYELIGASIEIIIKYLVIFLCRILKIHLKCIYKILIGEVFVYMNNRLRFLLKNVGILAISNFASKTLVFLLVPLYTSVLTIEEYGLFDLTISTVAFLFPVLTCNIADSVMRFSMDKTYSKLLVAKIGIKYMLFSTFIAWTLVLIIVLSDFWLNSRKIAFFFAFYFFFYSFNQFLIQMAKGHEKIYEMGVASVLGTVVMVAANIIFLLLFKLGLSGFFVANIMAQALPALYLAYRLQIWLCFQNFNYGIGDAYELKHEMLIYCMPLMATTLGWWFNSTSSRYIVSFVSGVGASGLLSVAYKIPQIINTLQYIFIQAWQISAIKEYGAEETATFYGRMFVAINVLMCISCSVLIFCTKLFGQFLFLKDFYDAWQYVPFLLFSCVLNSASGFLGPILSAKKDSKSLAKSALCGAGTNIALCFIFVYLFGVQGATIATILSSFVIYIVRKASVGLEIKIDNYQIVLVSWVILMLQAILEVYTTLWWCEIGMLALLLLFNRKILFEWMQTINANRKRLGV